MPFLRCVERRVLTGYFGILGDFIGNLGIQLEALKPLAATPHDRMEGNTKDTSGYATNMYNSKLFNFGLKFPRFN